MKPLKYLALLTSTLPFFLSADSPITSTDFYKAYTDIPMVRKADSAGVMDQEFAEYLCDPKNPIDCKAAVINALSWSIDGKHNAEIFTYYLALKNRKTVTDLRMDDLAPDQLLCLGYLTVLDDYFNPAQALPYLEKASDRLPNSYTVAIIYALAQAQKLMDSSWCQAWKVTEKVFENKKLKLDMRKKARDIIFDYMVLYREECE
jgi:hypothetical protein